MKSIVIYKSRTGFTERYAEWIAEELKCDIKSYEQCLKGNIGEYDLIIYGGNLFEGKVDGLQKIKERVKDNKDCKFIIFSIGATPIDGKEEIDKMWTENLSPEELKEIPHYYMPGGLNYEKMSFSNRMMMKLFTNMMRKKKDKTPYEEECAEAVGSSYDISSRDYIKPLIKFVKEEK